MTAGVSMRLSKRLQYAFGLAVLAAVVAAVVLVGHFGRSTDGQVQKSEPPPVSAAPPEARKGSPSKNVLAPESLARPAQVKPEEDEAAPGEFTTETDLRKQRVFKTEPKLAEFDYFREHVLQDSVTREAYRRLLSDQAFVAKTRNDLLHPEGTENPNEANAKRLMEIDYLRESIRWKENPARAKVMDEVARVISEDSFEPEMHLALKRSISATKMELYEVFAEQDPNRARLLVDAAKGTRLEGMLQYFRTHDQQRLAKEAQLGLGQQGAEP